MADDGPVKVQVELPECRAYPLPGVAVDDILDSVHYALLVQEQRLRQSVV